MAKKIPVEALVDLKRRLQSLPKHSSERREFIKEAANLYGISEKYAYKIISDDEKTIISRRSDFNQTRVVPTVEMEKFCEIVAAVKIRTLNKKKRHLSTARVIHILEDYGVQFNDEFIKVEKGKFKPTTVNRYLRKFGYHMNGLLKESPCVRFEAENSNDCWQFDLSPSDMKYVDNAPWLKGNKKPTLMLYSIVDDRSGVCYQEYHAVYGEDPEAALKFLFNAMSQKDYENFPFQGIPKMLYVDNGPVTKSKLFLDVMASLGVEVKAHLPASKGQGKTTARAKGKVERAFSTIKSVHETLYHFNKPRSIEEANLWLIQSIIGYYNNLSHRRESHTKIEDWKQNIPKSGVREMCDWPTFCSFARRSELRTVTSEGTVHMNGVEYSVTPELTGEKVKAFWGVFEKELYVEHSGKKYGPYQPKGGPIPLHQYRQPKQTQYEKKQEKVRQIAETIVLDRTAMNQEIQVDIAPEEIKSTPFVVEDPELRNDFSDDTEARLEIARMINCPLGRLEVDKIEVIEKILAKTLNKKKVVKALKKSKILR